MNDPKTAQTIYDFSAKNIDGEEVPLDKYKGQVLLVVNVARDCGLTATNYKELAQLDDKYRDQGLRILVR